MDPEAPFKKHVCPSTLFALLPTRPKIMYAATVGTEKVADGNAGLQTYL